MIFEISSGIFLCHFFFLNLIYWRVKLICVLSFCFPGPITEVDLPIDSLTKKIKGFAHVTYMLPEHAVKAFAELDGTAFMVILVTVEKIKPCILKCWWGSILASVLLQSAHFHRQGNNCKWNKTVAGKHLEGSLVYCVVILKSFISIGRLRWHMSLKITFY